MWDRAKTYQNIIEKVDYSLVDGGTWDKDSIMHYPFKSGMILEPEEFRNKDLSPAPGVVPLDMQACFLICCWLYEA